MAIPVAALGKLASVGTRAAKGYAVASTVYSGLKGVGDKLSQGDISGAIGSAVSGGMSAYNQLDKSQQMYESEKQKAVMKRLMGGKTDDQESREAKQLGQAVDNAKIADRRRDKTSLLEEAEYENRLLLGVSNSLDVIKTYNERLIIEGRKRTSDALKGVKNGDENEKLLRSALGDLRAANNAGGGMPRGGDSDDKGSAFLDMALTTLAFMPGSNIKNITANLKNALRNRAALKNSAKGLRDTVLNRGKNSFRDAQGKFRAPTKLEKNLVRVGNNRVGRTLVKATDKFATKAGNIASKVKAPSLKTVGKGLGVAAVGAGVAANIYDTYKTSTDEERINQLRDIQELTGRSLETQAYVEYGSNTAGLVGGLAVGALAGAIGGSIVPGLGNVVGALIGGAIGAFVGKEGMEKFLNWATGKYDGDGVPEDPSVIQDYTGRMIEALRPREGMDVGLFRMTPDNFLIGRWPTPIDDMNSSLESWNKVSALNVGVNGHVGTAIEHLKLLSLFSENKGVFNGWNLNDVFKYVASPLPEEKKRALIRRFIEEGLFEYFDDVSDDETVKQIIFSKTGKSPSQYLKSLKKSEDELVDVFYKRFQKNTPVNADEVTMTVEDYNKMLEEAKRAEKMQLLMGADNTKQMATGGVLKSQLNLGSYRSDSIQSLNDAQSDIAKSFEGAIKSLGDAMSFADFDDGIQNYLVNRMLPELGNTLFDLIQSDKKNRDELPKGLSTLIPIWG